jgi:hypothetical protein
MGFITERKSRCRGVSGRESVYPAVPKAGEANARRETRKDKAPARPNNLVPNLSLCALRHRVQWPNDS